MLELVGKRAPVVGDRLVGVTRVIATVVCWRWYYGGVVDEVEVK